MTEVRPQLTLPYNAEKVKEMIAGIVPEEYPAGRHDNIRFRIESIWKKGTLTKFLVDNADITHLIVKSNAQHKIETVLKMSKDFKLNFTGYVKFDVEKIDGVIAMIYVNRGHFALSKENNYKEGVNK